MTEKIKEQKFNISELQELPLEMLEKSSDEFANVKEVAVFVKVGGTDMPFKVEMYKMFSPLKIKQCVVEYIKNMDKARKLDTEGFGDISEPYLFYLFIKHFTVMGESMPNDFSAQIKSLEHMINTDVLFQLMVHFDEAEVERVRDELEQALNTFDDNYGIIEEFKKEAKYVIENEGIMD